MKCTICRNGMTERGKTTVVLEKEQATLVYKNVPAGICENCGEQYVSSETNKALLAHARGEMDRGVTIQVLNFAAP